MSRILIAMSGGVDSSVAAALLKRAGHDVVGVTMRLTDTSPTLVRGAHSCCAPEDIEDARRVADAIGIPFFVVNYRERFREQVIDYFVDSYARGETPNPCAKCNEYVKFDALWDHAMKLGCEMLATGHYARITPDGRLARGHDADKDQSYFLFTLTAEQIARTLFPVGTLAKTEVRRLAAEMNLPVAVKPDSQEVCFVPANDTRGFVSDELRKKASLLGKGTIETADGRVIGHHDGIHQFTVGQRRGLGVSGTGDPVFVIRIDPELNRIIVGDDRETYSPDALVRLSRPDFFEPGSEFTASVQIRHRHHPATARIQVHMDASHATVWFDEPQRAVTPGQAAVFYDGDTVIGGGWIQRARAMGAPIGRTELRPAALPRDIHS
ncbi:MAG: tRNA 2-thiouridine(34) synthase MnmA [Deltaproteobacteria bacterium]|nr:tRNA 2-thiouridine(34) synthase MnmA [Deltaproteobacteria bacterium]